MPVIIVEHAEYRLVFHVVWENSWFRLPEDVLIFQFYKNLLLRNYKNTVKVLFIDLEPLRHITRII